MVIRGKVCLGFKVGKIKIKNIGCRKAFVKNGMRRREIKKMGGEYTSFNIIPRRVYIKSLHTVIEL